MLIYHRAGLILEVESQDRQELVVKWLRHAQILNCDLDVVDYWLHLLQDPLPAPA